MRDSIKSLSRIQRFCLFLMLSFAFVSVFSCSDDKENQGGSGAPYDPNQPVKITKFYPDSGGMATKVIIEGSNFGTDISKIRVYYNEKKAAVVRSNGNMLYVITPRTPGDDCNISVVVGKDSLTFNETFEYTTTTTVSTITGRPETTEMVDGTLAEATFDNPRYICLDAEKNMYVSDWNKAGIRQINEEKNVVSTLIKENGVSLPNAPTSDAEGKVIYFPNDQGWVLFQFDPARQWEPQRIALRVAEDSEPFDVKDNWKHCVVANKDDGYMYTRYYNGYLIKYDGRTKAAWLVDTGLDANTDSYYCYDPHDDSKLYISFPNYHYIGLYNLKDSTLTTLAGTSGKADHQDGEAQDALFNKPRQICVDSDGNIYVADSGNHCIRKIDTDGIVTTVIGLPKVAGYVDGNPDNAQFRTPEGVAIDEDDIIYVADAGNKCIRKLAIE